MKVFQGMRTKILYDSHARMRALPAQMRGSYDMSFDIRPSKATMSGIEFVGFGRPSFNRLELNTITVATPEWTMQFERNKIIVGGNSEAFERDMLYMRMQK